MEGCDHPVIWGGMCGKCGQSVSSGGDLVHSSHSSHMLQVTRKQAEAQAAETSARLLAHKKLSLVLDLDHTLLHATHDPRASAYVDAAKSSEYGVKLFYVEKMPNYVKFRPHLFEFLTAMKDKFELHIYTHGTRSYANEIRNLMDPDSCLFAERIVTRTECPDDIDQRDPFGDPTGGLVLEGLPDGAVPTPGPQDMSVKKLTRIFPCDDSMVLAVDDRDDIWRYVPNLIKVEPYSFFRGFKEVNNAPGTSTTGATAQPSLPVLRDESEAQLVIVQSVLDEIHKRFYDPALPPAKRDVKIIAEELRSEVLRGTHILFSGCIPINAPPEKSLTWKTAVRYGAKCYTVMCPSITHVVAANAGTAKVRDALKTPGIFVVHLSWFNDSVRRFRRQQEADYVMREMFLPMSSQVPTIPSALQEHFQSVRELNEELHKSYLLCHRPKTPPQKPDEPKQATAAAPTAVPPEKTQGPQTQGPTSSTLKKRKAPSISRSAHGGGQPPAKAPVIEHTPKTPPLPPQQLPQPAQQTLGESSEQSADDFSLDLNSME